MLTQQEADDLMSANKLLTPNQYIDLGEKRNTLKLIAESDSECKFRINITSNKKIVLKTSVHHMLSGQYIGLLRIDFKGAHQNPANIIETLPQFLHDHIGRSFGPTEPHMHVYVEGYKDLVWAVPLSETGFPTQAIGSQEDVIQLISNFAKKINLKSEINFQSSIT